MRKLTTKGPFSSPVALAALAALSVAMSPFALGCSGATGTDGHAVTATGGTKAPLATPARGHLKVFSDALAEVPLRDDQRAEIEQMAVAASTRQASAKAAHDDLINALASQVEQGSLDRTALQPKLDAASSAFVAAMPADHAALEHLHALLDPTQRATFVDALEAKMQAKKAEHAGHFGHGQMLQEWATALKLTDAQQEQIRGLVKDQFAQHHGEWKGGDRKHGEHVFEAFRGERFVMAELAPQAADPTKAGHRAERFSRFLDIAQAVLPTLTAEQRSLAAAKIRARIADPNELEP